MSRLPLVFCGLLAVLLTAPPLRAQSDDPSEIFLKAYMTSQEGEKLEHNSQLQPALAKFRFAGSLLEELRKSHADWQPAIVEYRARKVSESILRVQGRLGTQQDLAATAQPPTSGGATKAEPTVDLGASKQPPPPANDAAIQQATKDLRARVDQLEAELQKSRDESRAAQKDKEQISTQLKETNGKLQQAQATLEKTQGAEREVRDQLTQAQDSLKKIQKAPTGDAKAEEALRSEIAQLKTALDSAQAGRATAERDSDAAKAKLDDANKQIAAATQQRDLATRERDEALNQLKGSREAQDRVQMLVAENSELKQKLADAEKTAREISEDKPKKAQELSDLKQQLDSLRQQLVSSQKQNQDFEVTIADLRSQLDDTSNQLDQAKLTGTTPEETARLTKENDFLRSIVVHAREEDARRDQAKKLMVAEFEKLKIKSDVLSEQINLLAEPVTKLSPQELAMLRLPEVAVSDSNTAAVKATFTVEKPGSAPPPPEPEEPAPAVPLTINSPPTPTPSAPPADALASQDKGSTPPSGESADGSGPAVQTSFNPGVPTELVPLAKQAKENFDRGKFRQAEQQYQQILAKSPNNLYSLSNLGVVLFRTGKLKAAEGTLKKAIAVAPQDEFSHTTLGIIYYRQGKFDEALAELTKSLGINPKSATAHNYLGITASQKGWQEAAEKEMLQAIAINPDYADAHFNLAVIYATQQPPAKELGKRHYVRATQLGAQPDPSLEQLLQ
jgi:Flp pilus assembly protein TadD/septal ring factor EnvC (AmiA/AmiB activator)